MTDITFEYRGAAWWAWKRDNYGAPCLFLVLTQDEAHAAYEGEKFNRYTEDILPFPVKMVMPYMATRLSGYFARHIAAIQEKTIGRWNVNFTRCEVGGDRDGDSFEVTFTFESLKDATVYALSMSHDQLD